MKLRRSEVAPGVHRLYTRYTNWYMIKQGGRLTVLDAGLPADWRYFTAMLARLAHSPADVDAVLITHHHPDHAGNAERLRSRGARVFAHPADASSLRGEEQIDRRAMLPYLRHPWYARYMVHLLASRVTRTPAVAELHELADGEVLDVPGSPRVIHAPGHTAGECALYLEERGVLFAGDALCSLNPMTRSRGPQLMPRAFNVSSATCLDSLTKLAGLEAEVLAVGHGEPWRQGVGAAVERVRATGPT
jgi:glyoxylase-like metal-dependent hydrolase (beta-lactamase superfamily II)